VAGIAIACAVAGAVLAGLAFTVHRRRAAARAQQAKLVYAHQGLPSSV
jgi:hypothetical protein